MRLELADVTAGYGDSVVLREVDLVVPSGSVVALLGPNGAGKTTLLGAASGLLRPSGGTVLLDDASVAGVSADGLVRRGMCHVREGRSIFPSLTVAENLRLFTPRGAEESAALEQAVDAFPRLGERMAQRAGSMSGGEQQMLALARAYLSGPRLVLLDEVSLGLAPILVDEIYRFLRLLVASGTTLLLVEQYVERALALADFVYLLHKGRVVFGGEPSETNAADLASRYLSAASVGST